MLVVIFSNVHCVLVEMNYVFKFNFEFFNFLILFVIEWKQNLWNMNFV